MSGIFFSGMLACWDLDAVPSAVCLDLRENLLAIGYNGHHIFRQIDMTRVFTYPQHLNDVDNCVGPGEVSEADDGVELDSK